MNPFHIHLIGLLLICSFLHAEGQADSILALPKAQQSPALQAWYADHTTLDSTVFLSLTDQCYKDFYKAGNEVLAHQAWMLRNNYRIGIYGADFPKALLIVDEALTYAIRHDWKMQVAELYIIKGTILRNGGRLVPAFAYLMKGYEQMKQIGFTQFADRHWLLYKVGIAYYHIKAYDEAAVYLRQAIEMPMDKPDPNFTTVTYNTLGICYIKQMQYDSAIVAYQKAHDAAVEGQLISYIGVTSGNIGYGYFKLGDDDKALPLLEEDFKISTQTDQNASALNASLALAAIYLKRGLRDKAAYHVQFASAHVERSNDNAMKSYFDNLSMLREIAGDFKSSLAYRDSSAFYLVRIQASEEKDIIERARLELEIEKHANEITSLETLRKKQILLRNVLLLFVVLTGIILVSLIQRRNRARKRQLEQARKDLTLFTDMIREKNEMLDVFSQKIDTLVASDQLLKDERSHHLSDLMNSHILTEDDWKQFRILFDKVHPGFFARLKEKMPDLNPAETRLLALTKLQLAPREMASMLGISYDSILKSRQRLRKKFGLEGEGAIEELLK